MSKFELDLSGLQNSEDPVSEVLQWGAMKFIRDIAWFHALANALRIVAKDPEERITSGTMIQKLWAKDPVINFTNLPSSKLHDITKGARASGKIVFNWAECMTQPSIQVCICADGTSEGVNHQGHKTTHSSYKLIQ